VGRRIRQGDVGAAARHLTLEVVGGNSPTCILTTPILDQPSKGWSRCNLVNQGQVLLRRIRRLLGAGRCAERFLHQACAPAWTKLRIGGANPLDKSIDIGAYVSAPNNWRVVSAIGGCLRGWTGAFAAPQPCGKQGCFYPPTLITDYDRLPADARKIFGPVLVATTSAPAATACGTGAQHRYGAGKPTVWSGENVNLAD